MEEENKTNLKTIHTYTSDMADAIRTNEASVIKIALAEKQKREDEEFYKKASGTPASKVLWILGGIVLIAVAAGAFYFVYKKNVAEVAPVPAIVTPEEKPLFSVDDTARDDITSAQSSDDIMSAIKKEETLGKNPGSIKEIILNQTVAGLPAKISISDLFSIMNISSAPSLVRNLDAPYMLGVYTPTDLSNPSAATPHLFLVLQVNDYNLAYKAMLDWEPSMLSDLHTLFQVDVSGDRATLLSKEWKDITINNKDGRILYDSLGNDVFYYIFLDKTNLVITDSKDAIKEINARLLTQATKPI